MTVAKSVVNTPVAPVTVATGDRGWLMLPLSAAEALPGWAAGIWPEIKPVLADRAKAAWQLALQTKPRTLLICAAVCLLSGFAVLAVALLASVLVLLLKLAAVAFAGVALWQWVSGAAKAGNAALVCVSQSTSQSEKGSQK